MDYETLPLPGGPFEHVETYFYNDGRPAFAMRSLYTPDLFYVVNTVDESNGTVTALVVGMLSDRFEEVRYGAIPFRDTFTQPGEFVVFQIVWGFVGTVAPSVDIRVLPVSRIPESWLPAESSRLGLVGSLSFA